MTVKTTTCKAKNPEACPYHKPNASNIAKKNLEQAQEKFLKLERQVESGDYSVFDEMMDAKQEVYGAEEIYYGTSGGVEEVKKKLASASEEEKFELELVLNRGLIALEETEASNELDNKYGGPLIPPVNAYNAPPPMTAGGSDLWPEATGSKYNREMTTLSIKKELNKDIKEAQRDGYLPSHLKFKVSSRGNSLYVTIIGAPDEQIYEEEDESYYGRRTRPKAKELLERVEGMVNTYNHWQYDTIEGRRNYTHFWENVQFESKWERELREEREAARKKK